MNYVLMFVFDFHMRNVLMMKRDKPPYAGCLNGIGGKIEEQDTNPLHAIYREMMEETGLEYGDVIEVKPLVRESYPSGNVVYVFYGRQGAHAGKPQQKDEGTLIWYPADELTDVRDPRLAGEGNTAYFINAARIAEAAQAGEGAE
mgnify:CR=1 FL=1